MYCTYCRTASNMFLAFGRIGHKSKTFCKADIQKQKKCDIWVTTLKYFLPAHNSLYSTIQKITCMVSTIIFTPLGKYHTLNKLDKFGKLYTTYFFIEINTYIWFPIQVTKSCFVMQKSSKKCNALIWYLRSLHLSLKSKFVSLASIVLGSRLEIICDVMIRVLVILELHAL